MSHGFGSFDESTDSSGLTQGETELVVRVHAAAFYVSCLKAGFFDEATEFAEWYLDTFDHDLET